MKLPAILRERPLLFWAAVFLALPALLLAIPLDWSTPDSKSLFERERPLDPYSDRVDAIDRKLHEGATVELSASTFQKIRPMLQARRLLGAGPMSAGEMRRAVKICGKMNRQIDREDRAASRQAMRQHWHDRLADRLPRLRSDRITEELERLGTQIDRHVQLER